MMLTIASNIAALKRDLQGLQRDQIPFAVSLTLNAFRFQRATNRRLALTVERKRAAAGRRYLEVQAQCGPRGLTGCEGQIAGAVGKRAGYIAAPNIRRNAHGNISRAQINRTLTGIGGGGKYFINKHGSRLAPGVYLRKRNGVSQVLAFNTKTPTYSDRYDFDGIIRDHTSRVMPGNLRKAMARARATAR